MKSARLAVLVAILHASAYAQVQTVLTEDGLGLHLTPEGRVLCLGVDGRTIAAPDTPGGLIIADLEAEPPAEANLIRNPSVETDADDDGAPDGWTLATDWTWDRTTAHSGTSSLRVTVPPGPAVRSSGSLVLARFPVEPGRRYVYSFWAKTKDAGGRYPSCTYIRQYDADGKLCAPQTGAGTRMGTNDWFLVRREFQPTPQTRFVDIYANIYKSHGTCWYDDFRIIPADASERTVDLVLHPRDGTLLGKGASQDIDVQTVFREEPDRIRIDVDLKDRTKRNRRIVAGFNIPIDASGWTWWDSIHARRAIDKPEVYEWCQRCDLGQGKLSIYPFSALSGPWCGVSLGVPLDQGPRIWRVAYDHAARQLKVRFYLGLSQETEKFPGKADFSFILYRHDPRWGLRATAKRFYGFYPEHFVKRFPFEAYLNYASMEYVTSDGNLNARGDVLVDAADFGESIPLFTHMHGGYACDFWPTDRTDAPTDDEVREFLKKHAAEIGEPKNSYTPPSQILKQITHDPHGKIRFHRKDCLKAGARYARPNSGGWFFEFRVMEDPEVSDWVPGLIDRRRTAWVEKHPDPKPFHYCMSSDEIQGYTGTGNRPDFRREHFHFADVPLSYGKNTLALARVNLMYDFLHTFLWPHSHTHNYLNTGNANYFNRAFCFPYVDMGMIEWEWDRSNPLRTGTYARTMSYHKLYRFWRVCGKGEEDPASVRTHLHRCLFWAIYPAVGGMQSKTHNLDEYRYLYRRYVPIVERLSAAGWEPVTHATASPEGVLVERYGLFDNGSLHFAIRNITEGQMIDPSGPAPKRVNVCIDGQALGIAPDDRTLFAEELTEQHSLPLQMEKGKLLLNLAIPNGETRVIHVSNRSGREAFSAVSEKRALERMLRFYDASSPAAISASPRSKNTVQLAKLQYRHLAAAYPARSDKRGLRIHVPSWPTAFKNRDTTLTIGLENTTDKPLPRPTVSVRSPFPEDVVTVSVGPAPEQIGPARRVALPLRLRVRDDVTRHIVPLCVTVADDVTRVLDVRVLTLAPECTLLPERLSTVTAPQELVLAMRNPFNEPVRGTVEIVPPKSITATNTKHDLEIAPGEWKRVTCSITVPEKQRDGAQKFSVAFTPTGQKPVSTLHALRVIGNRKRCVLPRLPAAPAIDGKLDEEAWQQAATLDDFRNAKNPVPAKAATRAKAGVVDGSLYLAFDCDEPHMEQLQANVKELNGPVPRDDSIEIRLAPGHQKTLFIFRANAIGTRSSAVTDDWEAKATQRQKGYTIEVRIPVSASANTVPLPGEVWGFNIIRHRRAGGGETTQWSQSNWTWGDPVFYGDLIFPPP